MFVIARRRNRYIDRVVTTLALCLSVVLVASQASAVPALAQSGSTQKPQPHERVATTALRPSLATCQ